MEIDERVLRVVDLMNGMEGLMNMGASIAEIGDYRLMAFSAAHTLLGLPVPVLNAEWEERVARGLPLE